MPLVVLAPFMLRLVHEVYKLLYISIDVTEYSRLVIEANKPSVTTSQIASAARRSRRLERTGRPFKSIA